MNAFVTAFPELTICILLGLIAIIGWMIRQSIVNLNTTMKAIVATQQDIDRRLTVQETICETCRKSCPEAHAG